MKTIIGNLKNGRRGFLTAMLLGAGATLLSQLPRVVLGKVEDEAVWNIESALSQLSPGSAIDLNETLPSDYMKGGVFSVDLSGSILPEGLHLSEKGILTVDANFSGHVENVVFNYEEPHQSSLLPV